MPTTRCSTLDASRHAVARRVTSTVLLGLSLLLLERQAAGATHDLEVTPAKLLVTAQEGASADVVLEVRDAAGAPVTGVSYLAETSYGSLSPVSETTPGRYAARLIASPTDMPREAVVMFSPQGRHDLDVAFRTVPVSVRTAFSARTEPRSRVSATVSSRTFGPVEAGRDGAFDLDVELPPGARETIVRVEDAAGNVTTSAVAVPLRPHDPLTVTLDRYRLSSDGASSARIFAVVLDDRGRPIDGQVPSATASVGEVSAFEASGDGLFLAIYTPPRDGREGVATLEVRLPGERAAAETEQVSLVRGLPGKLHLEADPMELVVGDGTSIALLARVQDAAGNGLPAQPIKLFAERGTLSQTSDRGDGTYAATLLPPDRLESGTLEVRALLQVGTPARIPAKLTLTANPETVPTSWKAFSLVTATVTDEQGEAVPGEVVLFHVSRGEGRVTPAALTYDGGRAFADFAADPTEEVVTVEATCTSVPSLRADVQISKSSKGSFTIVSRPALVALGGQSSAVITLGEDKRVLQDAVLLTLQTGAPARLVASADPTRLPADGQSTSALTATLFDARDNPISDEVLAWTVDRGSVSGDAEDDESRHSATFTSPEGRSAETADILVSHAGSGLSARLSITLDAGMPAHLALATDRDEMPADSNSTARLVATVTDASGAVVPDAVVSFSVDGGLATLSDDEVESDASGKAATTLRSSLQAGVVDVTAEVRERGLVAQATITLRSMRPERMEAEAVPPRILADGTDRSEIRVQVEDALGQPLEDEPLRLEVRGAARLTDTLVRTDVSGEARTFLSGTIPETAVVVIRSETNRGLVREVPVELALPLQVSIEHDAPACSLGVGLRAITDPQAIVSWDLDGDGLPDAAGASVIVPLSPGAHEVRAAAAIPGGAAGEARAQLVVLASPTVEIQAPARTLSGGAARLDASASTAAGGGTLSFTWDLDDDGEADDATGPVVAAWTQPDGLHVARVAATDAAGCTTRAEASVLFGDPPDMAVTATLLTSPTARPGETARFRVGWRNASTTPAVGVDLRCLLAGPLTFVALGIPAGGILDSPTTAHFTLGDVPGGAAGEFEMDVVAASDIPGGVANASLTVVVSATSADANPVNDVASAQLSIQRDVDLSVSFEAPASRDAGQALDVAVLVRNSRASDAPDASVELSWDRGEWTATPSPAGTDAGSVLTVPLGTIAGGGVTRVDLRGHVASKLPDPTQALSISARAFYAGTDAEPSNDAASVNVELLAAPDLVLTLEARPARDPALPGDLVEYVATTTNVGTTAARDIMLECRFTADAVSELGANPDGGVLSSDAVTFHLGDLDVGATRIVRFSVRLSPDLDPAIAAITNQSQVEGVPAIIDLNPGDNVADATSAIDVRPDLVLSVVAPAGVGAGSAATYTMIVTNRGARANGVQVAVDLTGAPVAAGGAASDPLSLVLDAGSIAWGQSVTLRQTVDVPCPQPRSSGQLASSFDLRASGASVSTTTGPVVAVSAAEDLAVQISAPASAAPGASIVATVTATALGCAPSESDTLDVTWPSANVVEVPPLRLAMPTLAPGTSFSTTVPLTIASVQPQMSNDVVVTASASVPDGTPADDIASASIRVAAAPDVALVAIDAPPDLAAGASRDVVVHARNIGTTAARGTIVSLATSDPVASSITPAGRNLRDLLPGEEDTATFTVGAAATLTTCANPTTLSAAASCAGDSNTVNDAATRALPVVGRPDLSLALDVSTPTVPAEAGSIATVRCTVTNIGTCPSTAGQIELTRDAVVLLPTMAGHGANTLSYPLPALAPMASVTLTFRFLLPSPLPTGIDVTTVDAVVSDPADTNASNDGGSRNVQLGLVVDLRARVTLEPDTTPSLPDGYVTAIVTIDNLGQRDATGVDVLATWDPLLASGGSLQWSVGAIPANTSVPHAFSLHLAPTMPAPSTTLTVTAAALSDPVANPQLDTTNDSAAAAVDIAAEACLRVVLAERANPAPAEPGGQLTYTATITNDGTTAAGPATLTLMPDARLAVVVDAGGGTPVAGGLRYTIASLAPGASAAVAATWLLPPFPVGTQTYELETGASATSPQDPAGGCPSSGTSLRTVVSNESDLKIEKRRAGMTENPPRRGTVITYDIVVTNIGRQASPAPVITDDYPPELQPVPPLPAGAADSGTALTWSGASLAPNLSTTYTLKFRVRNSLGAGEYLIDNCARLTVAPDASPANDVSCDDIPMALDVDLQVGLTCTARTPPAGPDSVLDCLATTTNAGSYDASNVQLVVDRGPLADSEPPGSDPQTFPLGPIAAGASVSTPFSVRILAIVPNATNSVVITATASATEVDADPSDNIASATTVVRGVTDLVATLLAQDVNGPPLEAGDAVDLELRLSNVGTKPARSLVASLTWRAALATLQAGGPFTGGGGIASSVVAAPLAPGDPAVSLRARLLVGSNLPSAENLFAPCGGGTCDGPERYVPDDTACLPPRVILAWPDLVTTLTASAPTTPARPGQLVTYSLSVTNVGTTTAHAVEFRDDRDNALTADATWASVADWEDTGGIVTLALPDIPVGATTIASYIVPLAATMPASRVTLLSASSCAVHDGIDRVPADNCAQAPIDVAADVDAYVTLTASPAGPDVSPGDAITLTAQVGNAGTAPAQQAKLVVTLPADVTFVQAPGGSLVGQQVEFLLGSVPALSSGLTWTVAVVVNATLPSQLTPLTSCATVSHVPQTDDVNAANDTSCLTLNGIAQADLVLTLVRTSAAPAPRGRVTYEGSWRNAGTTTATNARLILGDADDVTLIAAAPGLQPGSLGRTIPLGNLPPGAAGPLRLDYDVLPELPSTTNVLTMLATLASDTPELPANLADNLVALDEIITARPDPWTSVSLDPATPPAVPCGEVIATVTYGSSAAGETAASGVVTLAYDPGLIDQVVDAAGGTPTAGADGLTWTFSGLRPGQSVTVAPRLRVACVLPAPSNLVFVTTEPSGTNGNLSPANDLGVDGLTVAAAPDLRVTVEVLSPMPPAPAPAGSTLRCRVSVENIGTTRATSVAAFASWTPNAPPNVLIASSSCGGSCLWTDFGVVPVNAGSPIPRDFDLVVASELPAVSNILTIEGRTACAESEPNGANNIATTTATLTGQPDLVITQLAVSRSVMTPADQVRWDYGVTNVGSAPATRPQMVATYDDGSAAGALLFLVSASGAADTGRQLVFDVGADLPPGGVASETATFGLTDVPAATPWRLLPHALLSQEPPPFLLSRDANAADNVATSDALAACVIDATIVSTHGLTACMGGGVTVTANALPSAGVSYLWSCANGLGRFSSLTTPQTTFFPPVTPADASYILTCRVTDVAHPTCFVAPSITITATTACTGCGCTRPRFNIQYDHWFSRVDRPGDRTASPGETVAFVVRARLTGPSKSGWLLGGVGKTRFSFPTSPGGGVYEAWLPGDVWIDCGQIYLIEFAPAQIPADCALGPRPVLLDWVTKDECGNPEEVVRDTSSGDQVTIVLGAGNGVIFTDWGPRPQTTPP